jgi:hypothetical protein
VQVGDEWRYHLDGDFRLAVGVVSVAGLAYWIVAGLMITALALRGRRSARRGPTP